MTEVESTIEVWSSRELQAVLLFTASHPVAGPTSVRYYTIERVAALDASLFRVPSGFSVVDELANAP